MFIKNFKLLFCMFVVCLVFGAGVSMAFDTLPSLDAETLIVELQGKEKPFLLDVRQPSEYAYDHIEGSVLIPLGEIPLRLSEIPKDKPVVVYCRSGNRSGRAVAYLLNQGFTNVKNLKGGMIVWNRSCDDEKGVC